MEDKVAVDVQSKYAKPAHKVESYDTPAWPGLELVCHALRTAEWSDRAVAVAVLLMQMPERGRPPAVHEHATECAISQFLGYRERRPVVRRAIKRLIDDGWLRAVGKTGPGRRRTFEFWTGDGWPKESAAEGRRASKRFPFGRKPPAVQANGDLFWQTFLAAAAEQRRRRQGKPPGEPSPDASTASPPPEATVADPDDW